MSSAIQLVEDFINESRVMGYEINGSVFKVDFNGIKYTVGFWIRPAKYNGKTEEYELPGRCGKAKHHKFKMAVKMAIRKARRLDP